ncbi:MAG: hypothetical protein JWP47_416 [Polaromonas sp.]|nr:hypothetical protein [Polaromonas sp.]
MLRQCALLALLTLALVAAFAAAAAEPDAGKPTLEEARAAIADIQKSIARAPDDTALKRLKAAALAARTAGDATAVELQPQLDSVTARLLQLGTPAAGVKEAPDVTAQRAQLEKDRRDLDAQIRLARLLSVEAEQSVAQVAELRRQQFRARLGERTASILGPRFWKELQEDMPRDAAQLAALVRQVGASLDRTPAWRYAMALALLAAVLALWVYVDRYLLQLTATLVPPSRLRRSLHALTVVVLSVASVALCVVVAGLAALPRLALQTADGAAAAAPPLPAWGNLPLLVFSALCFGGYVAGLGKALLSTDRPSWRLSAMPDAVAHGLRWFPLQLAVLLSMVWIAAGMATLLNASLAVTVAIDCIMALAIGTTLAMAIMRGEQLRREVVRTAPDSEATVRPLWLVALASVGWLTLAVSLVALLAGYVAFGSFVVKQVVWTMVVMASAYLLAIVADDGFKAALSSGNPSTRPAPAPAASPAGAPPHRIGEQVAVLLSAVTRLVLGLLALTLVIAPFGEGPSEVFRRTEPLENGLQIGQVTILPGTVLQAALVLLLAVLAVKGLQRWLEGSYLPTTRLDPSMRSSATNLLGYVGYICAVALTMSAVGVGLERIAWVASALSVGIGFGLQAVVQNFVSGLILLAERPVKVGDWVSLGGVEGDIRSINMRATQIQLGDRSTVIVPNSEFITKTVRNVTHANPLGLVQIKLPLPVDARPAEVRQLLLDVLAEHPDVLKEPAPNVQLDGFDNGTLMYNATGFVSTPRAAYGVRSALLFEALQRLSAAGIALYKPPAMVALPGVAETVPAAAPAPAEPPATT